MSSFDLDKDRSIRLFNYLKELSLLRTPLVQDLHQYTNVFWINKIPNEPECVSLLHEEVRGELWLQVKKPVIPSVPELPIILEDWLDEATNLEDITQTPKLKEKIKYILPIEKKEVIEDIDEDPIPEYIYLKEQPEVIKEFDSYLTDLWIPWKEEYIRSLEIQNIYSLLFTIYRKQKTTGEQFELNVSLGLFNWKTPNGQLVHRHLLTIPCAFTFDSDNGVLSVGASPDSIQFDLEQDMLELSDRLDANTLKPVEEALENLKENLWNKEAIDSILRSYVQSLSADGDYFPEEYNEIRDIQEKPNVYYSPALILRKRSEKGFQQACSTITSDIENNSISTPKGILRIFNQVDDFQPKDNTGEQKIKLEDMQTYFPLEANDEQRKIIENLQTRNGVIVQGPPGTGKTHTIANLTSHLLATGKRVLITSQTPRALKVLKDKIPKELQALCVSLLGADSKSIKDLESVVYSISNKRDSWDPDATKTNINVLSQKLNTLKEKAAELDLNLRAIREKETFEHQLVGEYQGTALKIAEKLNENRSRYKWLSDKISLTIEAPLSKDETLSVLQLLNELNEDVVEQIQQPFPSVDLLISIEDFEALSQKENELIKNIRELKTDDSDQLQKYKNLSDHDRLFFEQSINNLLTLVSEIELKDISWLNRALKDLVLKKFSIWEGFYAQFESTLNPIKDLANKHNLTEISGVPDLPLPQLHAEVLELRKHFESGKGLGLPLLRPKPVKTGWYIVQDARVDGQKCDKLESIKLLEEALSSDIAFRKIEKLISTHLDITLETSSSRSLKVSEMSDLLAHFIVLFEIKSLINELEQKFQNISLLSVDDFTSRQLIKIVNQLKLIQNQNELFNVKNRFSSLIQNIKVSVEGTSPHPIVSNLIAAVDNRNGNEYSRLVEKLNELDLLTRKNNQCDELMQKIKTTLPQLYHQLLDNFEFEKWYIRFEEFNEAFSWAKANTWYDHFSNTNEKELTKELGTVEGAIKYTISELGSEKAWYYTLSTMTESQRQHLLAWKHAIRKVGKATGPNAPIYLRDAKYHMSHCRDAIPAWIMPLYRVFETFEMKPNLFDIVIIDEASQSGPEAIILQYLAKKLIVVGDDKQISPEYVGIKKEDVNFLRKQFLFDFKLGDLLDIESSFFDLTNVLFGGRITLREHFRCMPEIIQFSNMISYSHTPLIPLRQYPPNRLEPIIGKHIPTGYREGSGQKVMNKPEAEAIVKEIKSCIQNPNYKNKSIGVISLQNKGQAQLIEHLLIKEIGTEEIEKRNIICGDAYDFQGDERDIIFLSLVAAPGETGMRAIATEKDKRRFNVAVSRAKDQLWFFHTPTTNDFRNKECLRYQLINYCQNPLKETLKSNRDLCESDFERAVFDQISSKGFKVIPQHKVAGYRIDLVVEGEKGRIAVECDGDEWHGPDRYDYDMNRQRILERCGWKFWRVRGSEYYYDPENALNSLWETLEYYNIKPTFNEKLNDDDTENNVIPTQEVSNSKNIVDDQDKQPHGIKDTNIKNLKIHFTEQRKINIKQLPEKAVKKIPGRQLEFFSSELSGFHQQISIFDEEEISQAIETLNEEEKPYNLKDFLINKGYEVIDKRDNGGALWLIGGKELTPLVNELKRKEIHFSYTENGSRSTKKRPAWFTK